MNLSTMNKTDPISLRLSQLYRRYGYSRYKMGKFEEYDLYARNRDFLASAGSEGSGVIAFTDVNGKLMALKPDVTLSIVRHLRDEEGVAQRVFYDENVYRVSKRARAFREIPQVGLECLGAIDDYCLCEVLTLAAKSLRLIAESRGASWALDVSHLGLLSLVIEGVEGSCREAILKCVAEKNAHELAALCASVPEARTGLLKSLIAACGSPEDVLPELRRLFKGQTQAMEYVEQFGRVINALDAETRACVRVDFSVVSNLSYYNGIVFRGFVEGIPEGVLSGGQYDRLMRRMGHRDSRALGFAIYLDLLERADRDGREYDVDTLILYGGEDELPALQNAVETLTASGESVTAQRKIPEGLRFRRLFRLKGGKLIEERP